MTDFFALNLRMVMPCESALRRWRIGVCCLGIATTVMACAPPIDGARPTFAFANGWQNAKTVGSQRFDEVAWWRGLDDPVLNTLVATALKGSPDLAAARLRAKAARQETGTVQDKLAVSPDAEVTYSDGDFSTADRVQRAGLQYSFDFDLGRAREAERFGALARAAVAGAEEAAARLLLIGEVSEAYLALRHAQATLAHIDRGLRRQRKAVAIAADLEAAGQATQVGSLRGKARLQRLRADRIRASSEIEIQTVRLTILTGMNAGALPSDLASALKDRKPQPKPRLAPNPKVPADLLRNRPDLRVAEGNYNAARAALGSSRAALYPRLSLTGVIDQRDVKLGSATQSGDLRSIGPSLRLPVLPLRAARATVAASETRVEASYQAWTASVFNALSEVETALLQYGRTAQVETALSTSVRLNSKAYMLMQEAAKEGESSLADLAALEAELFDAETQHIDARLDRARSFVNLNLRLGTGSSEEAS